MQPQMEQIRARCREVFARAHQLYPHLNFDHVNIRFDLKGRAAGQAMRVRNQYTVRFNQDMLTREAFDHMLNDTVPHEIAHIVCFMDPRLGNNHDSRWAAVCRALGGTGERCHSEEVIYGRGRTYEYITDRGHRVRIGDRHHTYLQTGRPLQFKQGKGTITRHSSYSIVGEAGRTLAVPIQVQGCNNEVAPAGKTTRIQLTGTAEELLNQLDIADTRPAQPAPATPVIAPVVRAAAGESKAAVSRRIMLSGYQSDRTYEEIIAAMIAANGYDRQLARATFKANQAKVGIPVGWGQ